MSVNAASTIFDLASWIIYGRWDGINLQSTYQQPLLATILVTILSPPRTIERPRIINNFGGGSVRYKAMNCIALLLNSVLHGQSFQFVLVYNITNMHAMSHRCDLFACSSRVNI